VDINNGKSARARLAHGMIIDDHIIASESLPATDRTLWQCRPVRPAQR
jgi:hypothetical protein